MSADGGLGGAALREPEPEPEPEPPAPWSSTMADLYRASERVAAMKPSATAAVTDKAIELRAAGKDVISLS